MSQCPVAQCPVAHGVRREASPATSHGAAAMRRGAMRPLDAAQRNLFRVQRGLGAEAPRWDHRIGSPSLWL